jgi:hypothetical protein
MPRLFDAHVSYGLSSPQGSALNRRVELGEQEHVSIELRQRLREPLIDGRLDFPGVELKRSSFGSDIDGFADLSRCELASIVTSPRDSTFRFSWTYLLYPVSSTVTE